MRGQTHPVPLLPLATTCATLVYPARPLTPLTPRWPHLQIGGQDLERNVIVVELVVAKRHIAIERGVVAVLKQQPLVDVRRLLEICRREIASQVSYLARRALALASGGTLGRLGTRVRWDNGRLCAGSGRRGWEERRSGARLRR